MTGETLRQIAHSSRWCRSPPWSGRREDGYELVEGLSLATYTRPATAFLHRLPPGDDTLWWRAADWFHAGLLLLTFALLLLCFRGRQRG